MNKIFLILLFCISFSLDKDWQVFGNHEISINSIIIEFKEEHAPLLGQEVPLTLSQISNLKNLDRNNNFKSIKLKS